MKVRELSAKIGTKITAATVAMTLAMSRVGVLADDPTSDPDAVENFFDGYESSDGGIFGGVTQLVKSGGASLRSLITAIGVVFLICSISLAALSLTKKNATDREAGKQRMIALIIGAIIFFGSLALLVFAQNIANSVSSAVSANMGG